MQGTIRNLRNYHEPEHTKAWTTDPFSFRGIVFKGTHTVYCIQFEEKCGYELSVTNKNKEVINAKKIRTTPFFETKNKKRKFNTRTTFK